MTFGDVLYLFIKRTFYVPSYLFPAEMIAPLQNLQVYREEKTSWLISPQLRTSSHSTSKQP